MKALTPDSLEAEYHGFDAAIFVEIRFAAYQTSVEFVFEGIDEWDTRPPGMPAQATHVLVRCERVERLEMKNALDPGIVQVIESDDVPLIFNEIWGMTLVAAKPEENPKGLLDLQWLWVEWQPKGGRHVAVLCERVVIDFE